MYWTEEERTWMKLPVAFSLGCNYCKRPRQRKERMQVNYRDYIHQGGGVLINSTLNWSLIGRMKNITSLEDNRYDPGQMLVEEKGT
jgi:uncharacterized protein (UPF0303 family)